MRASSEIVALIVAAIMRGSRGVKQICIDSEIDMRKAKGVRKYIDAFRSQGLVYISGWSVNQRFPLYSWQPEPFRYCDAVQPARKYKPASQRRKRVYRAPVRHALAPNSVFALGAA